jgi:hypothetical protein
MITVNKKAKSQVMLANIYIEINSTLNHEAKRYIQALKTLLLVMRSE